MTSEPPAPPSSRDERSARDRVWFAGLRAGDEAAFEALYRAYYRPLLAVVAPTVRSGAVAEEIVADIFVELWQERHTLRVEHAVSAYLYAAARNRARNAVRHERVERRWRETAAPSVVTDSHVTTETERALDAPRIRAIVQRAVESLPPQRRMVLHLRWGRGMSYAEIARIMGSSVVAVERQLGRTLKALRLALPAWLGTEDLR